MCRWRSIGWAALFLAPSLVPLTLFTFWPMLRSIWISLHRWNLISAPRWVGIDNYVKLLTSPATPALFGHTLAYVAGYLPLVSMPPPTATCCARAARRL